MTVWCPIIPLIIYVEHLTITRNKREQYELLAVPIWEEYVCKKRKYNARENILCTRMESISTLLGGMDFCCVLCMWVLFQFFKKKKSTNLCECKTHNEYVGVMDEAKAYGIDDAMSKWQLQRRQTTMTTAAATMSIEHKCKLVMMRSGRWNALIKYSTRAFRLCVKSKTERTAHEYIDIANKNYDEKERARQTKKWCKKKRQNGCWVNENRTKLERDEITTRSWEKLEQLKWHTIEFNSFMHCINYQLIIIIVVDDTVSFFHSSSFSSSSCWSCFWRLCSFVCCVCVCASAFHFAHPLYLSLLFVMSFIPIGFVCVFLCICICNHVCMRVCTVVWLNAMVRNVNSWFEKTLANFHWICRLF